MIVPFSNNKHLSIPRYYTGSRKCDKLKQITCKNIKTQLWRESQELLHEDIKMSKSLSEHKEQDVSQNMQGLLVIKV